MTILGSLGDLARLVRPKVFVSYHHARDRWHYEALSRLLHDSYGTIEDCSVDDEIDSDEHAYVRQSIRADFIKGTSCTVVLIGAETIGRKYVDWEIKATLDMRHALLGVYLPLGSLADLVYGGTPPTPLMPMRLFDNVVSGYASTTTWAELTAHPLRLPLYVTEAKLRSPALIDNTREMMKRNGQTNW